MKKTTTRIGALALATVTTAVFSVGCGNTKTPLETVEAAFKQSYNALEAQNTAQFDGDVGSVEYKIDIAPLLSDALGYELNVGATAKAYVNQTGEKSALEVGLTLDDISVADVALHISGEDVIMTSDELFGDTAYGVGLTAFMDNFATSEFGEGGAFDLGLDFTSLVNAYAWHRENAEIITSFGEDLEVLWNKVKADIYDHMEARGEITMANGELTLGDETVKTTDVNFAYTGEAIVELANELLTLVRDHEDIIAFIDTYDEFMISYVNVMTNGETEISGTDDLVGTYTDAIDEALAAIAEPDEEFLTGTINSTVHISRKNGEVIGLTLDIASNDTKANTSFIIGPSIIEPTVIRYSFDMPTADMEEGVPTSIGFEFDVIENSEKLYTAVYTVTGLEEDPIEGTVTWDKVTGDYSFNLGDQLVYSGTIEVGEDYTTVAYNTITIDGETVDLGEVSYTIRYSDTMPEVGNYTDFLTMSEEELTAFANEVVASAQNILLTLVS
ncbi:MAG: hypothetical protein IJ428_05120 [Clostridia bacterium]|nr:hypothetical protein [Clostridia bacterium]